MTTNVRLSGSQSQGRSESDARFNYADPSQVIAASNTNGSPWTQGQYYSGDGGGSWSQTSLPAVSGDAFQSDPCVDWTSDGTAWALTVGVDTSGNNRVRSFKSVTAGASWTNVAVVSGSQTGVDKPNLWIDHSATSPYQDNMYALWWNGGPTYVSTRAGVSGSWSTPLQLSGSETPGGSDGGDIKTNTHGDVFAFWPSESTNDLWSVTSTDGGTSFSSPVKVADTTGSFLMTVPAQSGRGVLLYISGGAYRVGSDSRVYACWADFTGASCSGDAVTDVNSDCKMRIFFAVSTNGGTSWGAKQMINNQSSKNDQFFPRLAVDEVTGDLVVVYYDTVGDPGRLKTDVWMQTSVDGGVHWSTAQKITNAQTDEASADNDLGNQYGDYIGLTGYNRQYFACWTDRRGGGDEEIWGAPVSIPAPAVTFEIDRDHYGQDEIDAARVSPAPGTPAGHGVIQSAFAVVVDGFTARQLGITGAGSYTLGPHVAFAPSTGVSASPTALDSTDPSFPLDDVQRFRFHYDVDFGTDDSAFTSFAADTEQVTLSTSYQGIAATGVVTFMKQPDPYVLQGPQTWWLSNDIKLVQVAQGDTRFGHTMGTDPFAFLDAVTASLTAGQGHAGGENFDDNTDEDQEVITTAPFALRGFPPAVLPVFNFAFARVHYRALSQPADHVRVFFRLFSANSTSTEFEHGSTYRRSPAAYPVAPANYGQPLTATGGVDATDYVTIPCYGVPRQSATQAGAPNSLPALQFDSDNDKHLDATGGPIHDTFYGALLDINQSTPALPRHPPAGNLDGPWPPATGVTLEPVQAAFIRNDHQCLVAEVAFDPVAVTDGTQVSNSDKLVQRNISWSPVANPGTPASRIAMQNFEVRPTPSALSYLAGPPDEILIDWSGMPTGLHSEVFLPAVDADRALATADRLYPGHRLTRVDAHTIGCATGGVTYIPLPPGAGDGVKFAGLITVEMPEGIVDGQLYKVVVRQLTNAYGKAAPPPPPPPRLTAAGGEQARGAVVYGRARVGPVEDYEPGGVAGAAPVGPVEGHGKGEARWRRVLGTFQVNVPVSTKHKMVGKEQMRLSIFRWIAESVDPGDRWHPVFQRWLGLLAAKVGDLGGDADVPPSWTGLPWTHLPGGVYGDGVTGKVDALVYDHFGDFEGFILELHDGSERAFASREHAIERVVREAFERRITVTVRPLHGRPGQVAAVFLRTPFPA